MATIAEALALAASHHQAGNLSYAEEIYRRVLQADPDHAEARTNLGIVLAQLGRQTPAGATASPRFAEALALNRQGIALANQDRHEEAATFFRQALEVEPHYPEAYSNLANIFYLQGRYEEAVATYRQALRCRPDYVGAYYNLGIALYDWGDLDGAIASFKRAVQLQPDHVEAHWNLALLWLLQGDFQRGWPEYEWRWRKQEVVRPDLPRPPWDGSPLRGQTIYLYGEQGSGDSIQFIRYATLVKRRGGKVMASCPRFLLGLLASCADLDQVIVEGGPCPVYDVQAPLLSLPGLLATTPGDIPAEIPYLHAEAALVAAWRHELSRDAGLRVGIAWQGTTTHSRDRRRSLPLVEFAPLAAVPGVRLFSLQKGAGSEQLAALAGRFPVTDLGSRLDSFADTAAVLRNLDLVVTIDTALAHCAGALGIPAWVALPYVPDWRWLLEREDSPWYPSLRLFRQRRLGEWRDVFERIEQELRALRLRQ